MDEAWVHELMLERIQQCREALERAEAGKATPQDWDLIWAECGLRKERKNGTNR